LFAGEKWVLHSGAGGGRNFEAPTSLNKKYNFSEPWAALSKRYEYAARGSFDFRSLG